MKTLKTTNEYENGKLKKPEFTPFKLEFVDVEMDCKKHGKVLAKVLRGHEGTPCCPICEKEEEERQREEEERQRLESEQLRIKNQYKEQNIEPEYWNKTFADFKILSNSQKEALKAVKEMIERKSGKVILLGHNGVGKSLLGNLAVMQLGGKILSMYEITTMIRMSYSSKAERDELEIVNELASIPMLAIDEVGKTKGSEAELNWLSYILDKRHVRNLPFMLLSNTHLRRMCEHKEGCVNCFENFVNNDVISRLKQNSKIITMDDAPDYRALKEN